MSVRWPSTLAATVTCVALLAAACTGSQAEDAFHPTFESASCPDDVTAVLVVPVSCGYLTVLEDRSGGSGAHDPAVHHQGRAGGWPPCSRSCRHPGP